MVWLQYSSVYCVLEHRRAPAFVMSDPPSARWAGDANQAAVLYSTSLSSRVVQGLPSVALRSDVTEAGQRQEVVPPP